MKKPYLKISRLAEDQDLNQGALAALIGVSSNTMTARLKGTQPWRSDEIVIICRALHIPQEKIGEYFFPAIAKEERPHETLHPCIRAGRSAHWMRVHRTAVLEQVVPLGR